MRGLARKLAAVLVGFIGTWVTTTLTDLGIGPEEAAHVVSQMEFIVTVAIFAVFMFASEHLLKYIKAIFPGDWADELWRRQAGDQVAGMTKTEAMNTIERGAV